MRAKRGGRAEREMEGGRSTWTERRGRRKLGKFGRRGESGFRLIKEVTEKKGEERQVARS